MENTIREMCFSMGMIEKHNENPFGCVNFFIGDNLNSQGYFWYLSYKKHFIITKCDFFFCKDTTHYEIGRASCRERV